MNAPLPPPPGPAPSPDPELRKLLRSWEVGTGAAPGFAGAVWRRIEARPFRGGDDWLWQRVVAWFEALAGRPRFAAAYLGALLVAGLAAGLLHGAAYSALDSAGLQSRYVQSIDPLLADSLH